VGACPCACVGVCMRACVGGVGVCHSSEVDVRAVLM